MKFIKLESRGGNYLVVAQNVAWLRTAENGQTNVGIVGGQPLLVLGSIEEVAEKILAGLAEASADAASAVPLPVAASVAESAPAPVTAPEPEPEPAPLAPEPEPEPEPAPVVEEAPQPKPEQEPEPAIEAMAAPGTKAGAARPRIVTARSASMWERPAAPPKLKVTSQRMMGRLE